MNNQKQKFSDLSLAWMGCAITIRFCDEDENGFPEFLERVRRDWGRSKDFQQEQDTLDEINVDKSIISEQ